MAFVAAVPSILASIGGGSAVAGALTVGTAAAGAYSAVQTARAGAETQVQMQVAARREGEQARQIQIERRRELMRILAERTAASGAAGVSATATAAATLRDIRDNRNDLLTGAINSGSRIRALQAQGRNAVRASQAQAAGSLLQSAGQLYQARG